MLREKEWKAAADETQLECGVQAPWIVFLILQCGLGDSWQCYLSMPVFNPLRNRTEKPV